MSESRELARVQREFARDFDDNLNLTIGTRFSKLPRDQQKRWLKRDRELHPSSFPYCGLRDGYRRLQQRHNDFRIYTNFDGDYYVNVGSVAHTAIQSWVGYCKRVLGNWKCVNCKRMYPLQTKPRECKECLHRLFDYKEIGGVYKNSIYWHSDALYRDKRGRYWVIDYKTSYVSGIREQRTHGTKYPYKDNKIQIETYCLLLEKKLKIKIEGWMLLYAARDFPRFFREVVGGLMTEDRREAVAAHMKRSMRMFPIAMEATDKEAFTTLERNKLCPNRKFYDEKVHSEFNPCALHKICFKPDKLHRELKGELRAYEKRKDST